MNSKDLITAYYRLALVLNNEAMLLETLNEISDDEKKLMLIKEFTKRIHSCNTALSAALEGYCV